MECDAIATYVADGPHARTRTYPFRSGQQIPRVIVEDDTVFHLRAVHYEALPGVQVTKATPDPLADDIAAAIASAKDALAKVQEAKRLWNARHFTGLSRDQIVADVIANDTAVAGEAA